MPDLPVLLLKLRDYTFWLLPAYVLAVGMTAGWTTLIAVWDPAGYARLADPSGPAAAASRPTRWLLGCLLPDPPAGRAREDPALQLWRESLSRSATPLALVLTAALHPALAVLRLATTLLLCSALIACVTLAGPGVWRRDTPAADRAPGNPPRIPPAAPRPGWLTIAWGQIRELVDQTSTPLLASALLGGLLTAWHPAAQFAGWLGQQGALAAIPGALATILLPLPAGAEVPFARALQTYDVPLAAILPMLIGASLFNWPWLRRVRNTYGARVLVLYLLVGLAVAGGLGLLVGLLPVGRLLAGP